MKTKPILIIVTAVILLAGTFLFIRSKYLAKPEKGEIAQFLNAFNAQLKAGNADSAILYFDSDQNIKLVKKLVGVLINKTNISGKGKPLFKVSLNTEDAVIKFINPELVTAMVISHFDYEGLPTDRSSILFTIHKTGNQQYKIAQVDLKEFQTDYSSFQAKVIHKTTPDKDIYSPITLAAFKTAEQLKTRYDSVLWFDHVNNQTYYYVVKGKVPDGIFFADAEEEKPKAQEHGDYKIGLVDPGLKEIIPAEYDLIHNVGGTIDSLIEVEKGDKKGLYNLQGKLIVPVSYDEIIVLKNDENLALLKISDDYFYLKKDFSVSDKLVDFKIADALPYIKTYGESYTLSDRSSKNLMECNDRDINTSLMIPPSYLVTWKIFPKFIRLQNPLRKLSEETMGDGDGTVTLSLTFDGAKKEEDNWFQSAFYTMVDEYLGGRSGLYTTKKVLLVDKKQNRILGFNADSFYGNSESGGQLSGECNENTLKAINDSLFEFKTTSQLEQPMLDSTQDIEEGPYYHYLQIKNGKLVALKSKRIFPTQFVKLDDSYLQNCYVIIKDTYSDKSETTTISNATNEILQCMKNEIYASYHYKFKNPRWNEVFDSRFSDYSGNEEVKNATVDDSLTSIDKYNISFINSKLNAKKTNTLAAK